MAKPKYRKRGMSTLKKFLIAIGVFILIGSILAILEKTHVINFYERKPVATDSADKTTSTVPSAQEDFSGGDERSAGNTEGENEGSGNVEDLQGNSSTPTDSSDWISSGSGEIVVHSPNKNQVLNSGTELSGTSSLAQVSYRIIDNVSGVIAQGELGVVGGNFAGKINFTTSASEGRIDVFATHIDGSEFSNIEIPITFN
jgi:hypothetical protein